MAYVNTGRARATKLIFEYKQGEVIVSSQEYTMIGGEFDCGFSEFGLRTMSESNYLILVENFISECKQREGQELLEIAASDAIITNVELCPIGQ